MKNRGIKAIKHFSNFNSFDTVYYTTKLMCSHEWETSGELLALDSVMTNIWNHFVHKPTKIPMTSKHNEVTSLDS